MSVVNSRSVYGLIDWLDQVSDGLVARILLAVLGAILLSLSSFTLYAVYNHTALLESVVSAENFMGKQIDLIFMDIKDGKKELEELHEETTALKQRLDDLTSPAPALDGRTRGN